MPLAVPPSWPTRPKPNELDVIDLLLGVVIAVTLVVVSIRLRPRRSPDIEVLPIDSDLFRFYRLVR